MADRWDNLINQVLELDTTNSKDEVEVSTPIETSDKSNKTSQWRNLIKEYEANVKRSYNFKLMQLNKEEADTLKELDITDKDINKKAFLLRNLKKIEAEKEGLDIELEDQEDELNFMKARASGIIPDPTDEQSTEVYINYNDNPEEVKKALITANGEYKPTNLHNH